MTVIRKTRALVAGAAIAVVGVAVTIAVPAVAASQQGAAPVTAGSYYLALGDSVPFGYREQTNLPTPDYTKATKFTGYPELVGKALGLKVANASCPGETSSSFIDKTAQSNGCEADSAGHAAAGYRTNFPLHQTYTGSQLAYAKSFLTAHKTTTKLVTLMIGANDGFICQVATSDHCQDPSEIGPVVQKIAKNVATIVKALRKTGYTGQIVAVNYYSNDYTDTPTGGAQSLGATAINNGLDTGAQTDDNTYSVRVASAYLAFQAAAAQTSGNDCTAGLLTILSGSSSSPTCGVHPSIGGQNIIAGKVLQELAK